MNGSHITLHELSSLPWLADRFRNLHGTCSTVEHNTTSGNHPCSDLSRAISLEMFLLVMILA